MADIAPQNANSNRISQNEIIQISVENVDKRGNQNTNKTLLHWGKSATTAA